MAAFSYPKEREYPTKAQYIIGMAAFNKTKDNVKSLGFRWNPETKQWIYEGKKLLFIRDIKPKLDCQVQQIVDK
jgi:hypothetical protein